MIAAPLTRELKRALTQHARVVLALMLRDIKTRAGASYFGFLIGLVVPLAHLTIVLVLYIAMGRAAAIGTNITLYLASAVLPFVIWSYAHQKIVLSFQQNSALTSFPIVKLFDILIARSIVELLNAALIIICSIGILSAIIYDIFIFNFSSMVFSLMLAYILGVSTGYIFGLISYIFPGFMIVGFLIIPVYWIACGTVFIPDALPEQIRNFVYFFPLTHIVDYTRMSIYAAYMSKFVDLNYIYTIIIINIFIAVLANKYMRNLLTAK